jgi:Arc/MetJ-type ribon-helix-helix transcriptional regulator
MRTIVNISVPEELKEVIEDEVKKNRYSTTSEFFRALLRMWIEGRLVKDLAESRRELEAGKGTRLKSLKDLR